MDTMYQRSKIQEESLYYESIKHDGTLPIVGVNTFLPPGGGHGEVGEIELMRSTDLEKRQQVANVEAFRSAHWQEGEPRLVHLQQVARERKNTFEALMDVAKYCSLGSMSHSLYDVGGEYRRNM
jgi:methylmalonyl-CoA mutase